MNLMNPPPESRQIKRRFFIVALILGGMAFYVLIRYFAVMLNPPGADLFSSARERAERGAILDRNGRILALQTRMGNISVWRPDVKDIETLSVDLSPLLESSAEEIKRTIESSSSDFLYLKKQADQSVIQRIQSLRSQGRPGHGSQDGGYPGIGKPARFRSQRSSTFR